MGNSSSGAVVAVKLDQTALIPGLLLTGRVFLMVTADHVDCKSIDIAIRGYENTSVVYHTGSGKHRRRHVAHQQVLFLNATIALAKMPTGKLSKGIITLFLFFLFRIVFSVRI